MSAAGSSVAALRRAFDERFARPADQGVRSTVGLILVDLGSERFAMRLTALSGFEPLRRCVPLAGAAPGVLGIAGVRGRSIPVFDLAQALALRETEPPRWLALCEHAGTAMAFAFAGFAGQAQVDAAALRSAGAELARPHAPELVLIDQRPVPVIDVASLAAARLGSSAAA